MVVNSVVLQQQQQRWQQQQQYCSASSKPSNSNGNARGSYSRACLPAAVGMLCASFNPLHPSTHSRATHFTGKQCLNLHLHLC
jgi:hypothetical protein